METMTTLKIIFVIMLAVPVLILSFNLTGKLMDELVKKARRDR